jgi:predicted ATP-dependent Lon-type protease
MGFHDRWLAEERDRKAIVKIVSGLLKLLHPDGQCEGGA